MKVRWLGVGLVLVLIVGILLLKSRTQHNENVVPVNGSPVVFLVADLREANDSGDGCAAIIRAVRQTSKRGVSVVELPADSKSDLIRRHHVLIVPTVLLIDKAGKEVGRFEGEDAATVKSVQARLATLGASQ